MKSRAQRYRYVRHVVSGTRPSPWSPLSLGSSLAAWYRADAGCFTDAACLFASASSQYLSRADAAALRATSTSFTLIAFVNPTDFLSFPGIVGKGSPDASGGEYALLFDTDGTVRARMRKADDSGFVDAASAAPISTGSYAMLEAYYDIDNGKVGLRVNNGTAVESTMVGGVFSGTSDFKVSNAGGAMLNGSVARVMLTKRLLTAGDRTSLYNAGAGKFYADLTTAEKVSLVEYWNLCESSSTRVGSHAGLNLTPTNGPTVAAGPGEGAAVNNSPVKRWEDQSGNGKHWTQTDITKQFLYITGVQNGLPMLRPDAVNDYMDGGALPDMLAWAGVWEMDDSTNLQTIISDGNDFSEVRRNLTNRAYRGNANTSGGDFTNGGGTLRIGGVVTDDPGAYDAPVCHVFQSASGISYASASMLGDSGGGLSRFWGGDIGEIVGVDAAMSAGSVTSAESYFRSRWGV